MNFKKYIKGAAGVALSALMLTSCASDYLDTPVHGIVPADKICDTPESARRAMLGVFGWGMSIFWTADGMYPTQTMCQGETGFSLYLGEVPGSDCYVNFIYDQAPNWVILYNMQDGYLSSGDYVWSTTYWLYSYSMLAQVNEILATIDACNVNSDEDIALRDFTKAQALTMRAHCYWRLLQVYAPRWVDSNNGEKPTVPLRTSPEQPQDMAAAPMKDVLAQCYKDLNDAVALFEKTSSFRTLTYEIDKNVCYGVYARIAALKNDWKTVRDMAHNARQGKRIATSEEIFNGYNKYNENEWMWAPSFESIDNMIYGNWCTFNCCNTYGAINDRQTLSINRDLYKLIPEGDERANWWFTYEKLPGISPRLFYQSNAVIAETGQIKNNRIITAAKEWLASRKPANITGEDAYASATTSEKSTSLLRDGAQVKFWANGLTGEDGLSQVPYMRATEMYLYEAEACAELGMTTDAQALLNEINQPRNPGYNCTLSGQALIDEVRLYRRIELWGEGYCWFDLKRWNLPMKRTAWKLNDVNSGNIPIGLSCDVPASQNKGWRYGIPYSERTYNNLITEPIPGEIVTSPVE